MSTETYKMELRKQILVFVSVKSGERLEFLDRVLRDAGAEAIGPQAYSFRQDAAAPEAVASAAGDLDAGECIYILSVSDGALVNHMLVPPRITGGSTFNVIPETDVAFGIIAIRCCWNDR